MGDEYLQLHKDAFHYPQVHASHFKFSSVRMIPQDIYAATLLA